MLKLVAEPEKLLFEIDTGSVSFTAFNLAMPSGCIPPSGWVLPPAEPTAFGT